MRRKLAFMILLLVAATVLVAGSPASAFAATWKSNDSVTVPSGTTIDDDLYVGGGTVTIDGDIDGNLFIGGGNVFVNGDISKSLFIGGGTITVTGYVGDIVLIGGGQISISGSVRNDILVGGGTVNIAKDADIGRDLLIGSGTATMGGNIGRNVWAGATDLTMTGSVGKNVRFEGDNLRLEQGALIGGDLTYYSANKATIDPDATVEGKTTYHKVTQQAKQAEEGGLSFVGAMIIAAFWFIIFLIGRWIVGLVLVGFMPRAATFSVNTLREKPWQCLGIGVIILMVTPMACLFIAVTLIGLPLAIIVFHLYVFAIYASMFVTGLFLGRWLMSLVMKREPNHIVAMLLGVTLLALITSVPFIGWLISLASVAFGTGSLALGLVALVRIARAKPVAVIEKTEAPAKEKPKKK